jgi:hypothetical protein
MISTGPRLRPHLRPRELSLLAITALALVVGSASLAITRRFNPDDPLSAGTGFPLANATALAIYLGAPFSS